MKRLVISAVLVASLVFSSNSVVRADNFDESVCSVVVENDFSEGDVGDTEGFTDGDDGVELPEVNDAKGAVEDTQVDPELNVSEFKGCVGEHFQIEVTGSDSCVYRSIDSNIAVVSSTGMVECVSVGNTVIEVETAQGNKLSCSVEVTEPMIDTSDVRLKKGEEFKIEVKGNDSGLPVEFSTDYPRCSVNSDGVVSMSSSGDAVVDIKIGNNISYKKRFTCYSAHEDYFERMQPAISECLGTPYVFGGETPGVELDCSGYVSYVYKSVGLISERYTAQGFYDICKKVDEPQVGDMVFFAGTYNTSDYITHIGIYAGNGEMYHSGKPNQKVSLSQSYFANHLVGYGTLLDGDSPMVIEDTGKGYTEEDLKNIWYW